MNLQRTLLIAVVAVVVVLGLGYAWGRAGRGALESTATVATQRVDLLDARGAILEARISLYNNNFGDASRHFEAAKAALQRLKGHYDEADDAAGAGRVDTALRHVEEGQRLAGALDAAAQNAAAAALEALKTP